MKNAVLLFCCFVAVVQSRTIDQNAIYKPRIVNGTEAKLGEIPYQVLVHWPDRTFCGGSIINEYWVVTAAHCVDLRVPASYFEVVAGTIDLEKPYSTHKVSKKIVHEDWSEKDSFRNDIALVKVATPFQFSFRLKPVALPKSHFKVKTNSTAIVSGWGFTGVTPYEPPLQKATLFIGDSEACEAAVKEKGFKIHPTQICANNPNKIIGACDGDSGGPLTVDGVLIGITSWTIKILGCGTPQYPGVYTRVSEYVDWIHENTK